MYFSCVLGKVNCYFFYACDKHGDQCYQSCLFSIHLLWQRLLLDITFRLSIPFLLLMCDYQHHEPQPFYTAFSDLDLGLGSKAEPFKSFSCALLNWLGLNLVCSRSSSKLISLMPVESENFVSLSWWSKFNLSCIKPVSVGYSVYGNINKEACLLLVSFSKGCTSLLSSLEWCSFEPKM